METRLKNFHNLAVQDPHWQKQGAGARAVTGRKINGLI